MRGSAGEPWRATSSSATRDRTGGSSRCGWRTSWRRGRRGTAYGLISARCSRAGRTGTTSRRGDPDLRGPVVRDDRRTASAVGSGCKDEWVWALKYKKPVIPLRLHPTPSCRSGWVRGSTSTSAETSRRGWRGCGASPVDGHARRELLRELRYRLADAERELPRADAAQQGADRARRSSELRAADRRAGAGGGRSAAAGEQTDARIAAAIGARAAAGAPGGGAGAGEVRQPAADDRADLLPGPARGDRADRGVPARRTGCGW